MMLNDPPPDKTHRQAIEAEAARLVIFLDGDTDMDGRDAAYRWINSHPYHAVAFAAASEAWSKSERIRLRGEETTPDGEDADAPVIAAPRATSLSRRKVMIAVLSAAAAAVAGVGVGWQLKLFGEHRTTKRGERETARLVDGSSIAMNGDTSLDVMINDRRRQVRLLRGEAMFEIAKDPERPFLVDLGDSQIRVLGTKFNIRRKEGVTELAVTEGVVAVSTAGADPVVVRAGSAALIRPGIATTLVDDAALVQQQVAWTEGFLEFDEEPLGEVVEEFNRYRNAPLIIGDPRIAGTLVTGRFGIDEGNAFVAALDSSFGIKAREEANGSLVLMQSD